MGTKENLIIEKIEVIQWNKFLMYKAFYVTSTCTGKT